NESGYVQVIELDQLAELAEKEGFLIDVRVRPGHFLLRGNYALIVWSNAEVSESARRTIQGAFTVGQDRTPTQDLEYSVRQLVEIAVRALSPGINDPFTAVAVINRLASALELAALNDTPITCYTDKGGKLRVLTRPPALPDLFDSALNQI